MPQPLVSIICLCYNHERCLRPALDSVLAQTYPNLEVIIVDDCSTDNSVGIIREYVQRHPQLKFISTGRNLGNTKAFNIGWRASHGRFILDFATDDVLLPERVAQQVQQFEKLPPDYGVVYSDAEYISDDSEHLYLHSQKYKAAPDGDVFAEVLGRYFICPPTMLIRREVFEELHGYDEGLAYEDFDFWIRSARKYKYAYLPEVTTKRRLHSRSLSSTWYTKGNQLLASTVVVCKRAAKMVRTEQERNALARRLKYEARQAYLTGNFTEAEQLLELLEQTTGTPFLYRFIRELNRHEINLGFLRTLNNWLRYRQ
ncbi:glycosyltransferase [Pontibacter anaerobius]|uniref:Glycosyltransferase n=1 Tax=Pontibacter anaerobius TaxID=2993940 RepID=A0ABT3RA91_9BACT|nr:glycosyltransferase [Pontibacter anaerobius]MCX2738776.1 glycosyltransferase [Pontibacter anaerobius]